MFAMAVCSKQYKQCGKFLLVSAREGEDELILNSVRSTYLASVTLQVKSQVRFVCYGCL